MKDFGDSEEETPPERGAAGDEGGEPSPEAVPTGRDDPLLLPPPSQPPELIEPAPWATTSPGSPSLAEMREAEQTMGEGAARPRRGVRLPALLVVIIGFALWGAWLSLLLAGPRGISDYFQWGVLAASGVWVFIGVGAMLTSHKTVYIPLPMPSLPSARFLWEVLETLLLAVLIFLAVRASFQNFRVEGLSMVPSLSNEQYLIVNKLAYSTIDTGVFDWVPFYDAGDDSVHHIFGVPGRGDVIVFQAPSDPSRDFIKRIIGVPGDHIEIAEGKVVLNGEVLEETYINNGTTCAGECVWDVAEGHYFVLGDNRPSSSDSRAFGPIPEANIIGKAFISYWPLDNIGLAPNHSISYAGDQAEAEG